MEQQIQSQQMDQELTVRRKNEASGETGTYEGIYFEPPVDIYETDDALTVLADLPGVEAADVETELKDNLLTLTARTRPLDGKWRQAYQEFRVGHFQRHFRLGQQIDQAKITAELKDGVLRLTLPKADNARPRRIQVKGG